MKSIYVAGGVLALAVVFGLGVVVGRFVLEREPDIATAPTPAIPGMAGLDNPLSDPNAALGTDPDMMAEAPAAPLPPAAVPRAAPTTGLAGMSAAQAESEAAMAAAALPACDVRVSRRMPVKSWGAGDALVATASGTTCGAAVVRIQVTGSDGGPLYTLSAPASDFGLDAGASADALRAALDRALPAAAVRAAAYPAWSDATPAQTEFSREAYDAIRAADAPVVCLKLPTAPTRCLAADPASGQVRVFNRG